MSSQLSVFFQIPNPGLRFETRVGIVFIRDGQMETQRQPPLKEWCDFRFRRREGTPAVRGLMRLHQEAGAKGKHEREPFLLWGVG